MRVSLTCRRRLERSGRMPPTTVGKLDVVHSTDGRWDMSPSQQQSRPGAAEPAWHPRSYGCFPGHPGRELQSHPAYSGRQWLHWHFTTKPRRAARVVPQTSFLCCAYMNGSYGCSGPRQCHVYWILWKVQRCQSQLHMLMTRRPAPDAGITIREDRIHRPLASTKATFSTAQPVGKYRSAALIHLSGVLSSCKNAVRYIQINHLQVAMPDLVPRSR